MPNILKRSCCYQLPIKRQPLAPADERVPRFNKVQPDECICLTPPQTSRPHWNTQTHTRAIKGHAFAMMFNFNLVLNLFDTAGVEK